MEEKEDGLTLGEIFHVILIKKWILLIVTVLVMLLGVIFVQVLYNPKKVEYITEFEIRYPNSETERYPDGSDFLYKEFISLDNLNRAKEQNESFKSIDVENLHEDFSIKEEIITINEVPTKTGQYTATVLKKYFSSDKQATDFIHTLFSLPITDIKDKSKSIEYDRFLKQFDSMGDYVSQIDLLIKQKDMIISGYENMITTYSNAITIDLGDGKRKTINEAQNEIEGYFSFYDLESMKKEVELKGYIHVESDYLQSIKNEIETLKRTKEENEKKIEAIYKQIANLRDTLQGTVTDVAFQNMFTQISDLAQRNIEIDHLINVVYQSYLTGTQQQGYTENLAVFQERLNQHYKKLIELTTDYENFNEMIYEQNTKVLFDYNSIIIKEGGINILLALVLFLIIGFVLSCCINLALDLPKYLKEKKQNPESLENLDEDTIVEENE